MTSTDLPSGSDRVHAVAQTIDAAIYVNIQGDEPMLRPEHITALLATFSRPHVEVSTLKVRCIPENIPNPNAVKVVTATDGRALYFSRATIPYDRDPSDNIRRLLETHWSLRLPPAKTALNCFPTLSASMLERTEKTRATALSRKRLHRIR